MFPEENRLRSQLARRSFRSPEEIWPGLRQGLSNEKWRRPALAWSAGGLAVLLVAVLAILRGPEPVVHRPPDEGFGVTNVRSLGRPAASIVLRPDPQTLIVVVD